MSINEVVICGRLTRDCEVKRTQSGTDIVNFRIAVNEWRKKGEKYEEYTNFFNCVCFNEKLAPYLTKGTKVTIEGSLHYEEWQSETGKRSKTEIKVRQVEFPPKQSDLQPKQDELYDDEMPF